MEYHARCHCGRVRFSFRSPEITAGKRCNCSLCVRRGAVLSEDLGRSGCDRAARLVELGAKRPDRAAALCQEILVLEDALDAGAKPILGRSSFFPSLPLRGQLV